MQLSFWKYHGTGNDFIIIDQSKNRILETKHTKEIRRLCDRHFGIGADGLIWIENSKIADFKMVYFNSDGNQSSMCGNGGRCIVHLAKELGFFENKCCFEAIDGLHTAFVNEQNRVHLQMKDVLEYSKNGNDFILDTGSPHYVKLEKNLDLLDVKTAAHKIRYSEAFKKVGINVNFIRLNDDFLHLRTYERGVEDETLSCGTGVIAAALVASLILNDNKSKWKWQVKSMGGMLEVHYDKKKKGGFENIWLIGPAELTFKGVVKLEL